VTENPSRSLTIRQPTNALASGMGDSGVEAAAAAAGSGEVAAAIALAPVLAAAAATGSSKASPFCDVQLSQPPENRTRTTPLSLVRHSSASTRSPTSTNPVRLDRFWSKPSRTAERLTHVNTATASWSAPAEAAAAPRPPSRR
jgi:hypothetical protein